MKKKTSYKPTASKFSILRHLPFLLTDGAYVTSLMFPCQNH